MGSEDKTVGCSSCFFLFFSSSFGCFKPKHLLIARSFFLGQCSGDVMAEIIQLNAGTQEKCQAFCELYDIQGPQYCEFYRFDATPSQGVDRHLFNEPFRAYVNHCKSRGGPKREGANQGSSCFSPSGDTCEVAQQQDCVLFGAAIDGIESAPDEFTCEKLCGAYPTCQLWFFDREEKRCSLFDDAGIQCNKIFGPHSGSPQECGSALL